MNKQEAIQVMLEGKKVTHKYFTSEEWMTMPNEYCIEFEDGCLADAGLFWASRNDQSWEDGYRLFEKEDISDKLIPLCPTGHEEFIIKLRNNKNYNYVFSKQKHQHPHWHKSRW